MNTCPNCNSGNVRPLSFCARCGTEKAAGAAGKCSHCGSGKTQSGTFCQDCGTEVPTQAEGMGFDFSDSPQEPASRPKKSPPPVPQKSAKSGASWDQSRRSSYNPGMPPARKNEATPYAGPDRRARSRSTDVTKPIPVGGPQVTPQQAMAGLQGQPPAQQAPQPSSQQAPGTRRRTGSSTQQLTPQGMDPTAQQQTFDVSIPGVGTYRTSATDPQRAALAIQAHLQSGGDPDVPPNQARSFNHNQFQVKATTESTAGGSIGAGPQLPLGELGLEHFRALVNKRLSEIVRKKEGGGGYNLYSPNKGKRKKSKPVGEFPTRLAAKRAELARFPPKDPEQLKRARKRLDKLAKDPKKRQDAERKELSAKKPKRVGKAAGERKAKKEALIQLMASQISERLFREDEVPGSPWDERIANLHPNALSKDKKLHRFHQGMEKASVGALGDSHKALAKVLRGLARVNPGEIGIDPNRGKMFMPVGLDVDGDEIGPVHLYIDGGNVCIEVSEEAREAIASLDPRMAQDLRGGLMSFQEDHLPKIDRAKKAWSERDSYLDKLHQRLEKSFGGMSDVEHHLMRQMMNKRRR